MMRASARYFLTNISWLLTLFVALGLLQSCRSVKVPDSNSSPVLTNITKTDVATHIEAASHHSWELLQVPLTIRLRAPQSVSVSATLSMRRGEEVMFSLRFFGIEIGYLDIKDRQILVVDKVHKKYVFEPVDDFLSGFNVTMSNLQDLLVGRLFITGEELTGYTIDRSEIERMDNGQWCFIPMNSTEAMTYGFTITPAALVNSLIVCAQPHGPVTIGYGDFVAKGEYGTFASRMTVEYATGKIGIDATLEYNYTKAKFNSEVNMRSVAPPEGYSRIPSSQLSLLLENF